jgi:hypothetical protein
VGPVNWGAIALGTMAGLGGGLLAFMVLGILGVVGSGRSVVPLIFVQYLALLAAGYVGGRFDHAAPLRTGARSALLLLFVTASIGMSINTSRPSIAELGFFAVVALILGYAGGGLAEWLHHQPTRTRPDEG